ncbi:PREDICTED: uncharacterized protein LOC104710033 [Camelina sativa]|uniref:Uncharacterized protein LOC104710033 n=1 Tax=Camelina sativa TaxID=90675 RepID=A0ABM0TDR2_CAMSA|nr:PREDICTED: uncharacterized protein LOC104710033 [Camelina sativa]
MAAAAETVDTTQGLLNINMMNVTKLTSTNYITWILQVHSLLDGYDLAGYIDGSKIPPDQTLTSTDPPTPNPAYSTWRRQDKLIYSGLLGTLSSALQPMIKQTSKGDKTVDEYMQTLMTRFDQLALLGKPLAHEEQLEFIFAGLPEDYKSVVDQVEGHDTPPSIIEVHEKLINKEAKLLALSLSTPSIGPASAHVATSRQRNNTGNAKRCTHLQQQHSFSHPGILPSPFRPWQPHANLAVASNPWVMDIGSTHHLTSDLHNLALHQPYNGEDSILIGDGSGLSITNTGSLTLPSNSHPLSLNNVLCVPNIQKNLISVKDLSSGVPLIQGRIRGELYE